MSHERRHGTSSVFDQILKIYLFLFFSDSLMRTNPMKDPTTDTANTRRKAGIAIAYVLGRNNFRTAGSSRKGYELKREDA